MADTTNLKTTFDLICPDPDCAEPFQVELDPAVLTDDGDLITCPECFEEWEWEYEAGNLQLLTDEDQEEFEDPNDSPSEDEED